MCGITGFISKNIIDYNNVLNIMISNMNHRGPDSNGIYENRNLNVGLGQLDYRYLTYQKKGINRCLLFLVVIK